MQLYGFKCQNCDDTEKTLNIHHRYYVSGRMPWEYPDFCYQVLCKECHEYEKEQWEERRLDMSIGAPVKCHDEWEEGLNYFGDKIFDLMVADIDGKCFAERINGSVLPISFERNMKRVAL